MSSQTDDSNRFHGNAGDQPDPIPGALSSGLITQKDADLIQAYTSERSASTTIRRSGLLRITRLLVNFRRWSGPYSEATITDLYAIIDGIKNGDSKTGKAFKPQTQRQYISRAKAFFCWLEENGEISIPRRKLDAIKIPGLNPGKLSAADLLTSEEVMKILEACTNSRNRALFSMLYEGGFRIGEVATMRWGALKFDSAGVVANVVFKTNKPRYIRLIMCRDYLAKWKSDYPLEITPDAFVFLSNRKEMLKYPAVVRILDRIIYNAGIEKRVNLHLFRHSRATHLIQQGVPDSVIKMMLWGSVNAGSFSTYAHLAGTDVDREICKLYGIKPAHTNEKEKAVQPKICPYCHEICGPVSRFCSACGQVLTDDEINSDDELKRWLIENQAYITAYLNKLNASGVIQSPRP